MSESTPQSPAKDVIILNSKCTIYAGCNNLNWKWEEMAAITNQDKIKGVDQAANGRQD